MPPIKVYTLDTRLPPLLDHRRSRIGDADCCRSIVENFPNLRDNRMACFCRANGVTPAKAIHSVMFELAIETRFGAVATSGA